MLSNSKLNCYKMKRFRYIILLLALGMLTAGPGCTKYYKNDDSDDTGKEGSEESGDYSWDNSKVVSIVFNGTTISEKSDSVTVDGTTVTITGSGTYRLTGSLTDGHLIVNAGSEAFVRLLFGGTSINCSSGAPVVVQKASKVIIILEDATENTLTDGLTYVVDEDNEPNAALFSKAYLGFSGKGTLYVKANYSDGITSKDGMTISAGTFSVTAKDDGIRGKDYLVVHDGKFTVSSGGDGLKSDNEEAAALGYISIDKGSFKIAASGDAVSAKTNVEIADGTFDLESGGGAGAKEGPAPGGGGGTSGGYSGTVSAKGIKGLTSVKIAAGSFTINSADDALHSDNEVSLNGGTFTISTGDDAIHADKSILLKADSLNILSSYEGIESGSIDFVSGYMSLVTTDDGFNATMGTAVENDDGSKLKIEGGNILVNSSDGDGIDSNGSVQMTGGVVIVHGPKSQPEVGIDVNGSFNISGGILLATGPNSGNMIEATSSSSQQYAAEIIISSTLAASTLFHIEDAEGKELITYKPFRAVYYVVFSSPELSSGSTYSVFTGGSSTGTLSNGVYSGGTYSGGTLRKSFVISNKVTSVSF